MLACIRHEKEEEGEKTDLDEESFLPVQALFPDNKLGFPACKKIYSTPCVRKQGLLHCLLLHCVCGVNFQMLLQFLAFVVTLWHRVKTVGYVVGHGLT